MSKPNLSTLRLLLILTIILLAALVAVFMLRSHPSGDQAATLGGDFTLQSANGPVSLSDYRNKVVVLYIGYASCPDVCPTALAVISQAFRDLEEHHDQLAGLFVSVDPERDTPEKLHRYAQFFSPLLTGVTGEKAEVDQVVTQYGAFYHRVELPDSAMKYAVDHSSRIYVIDQQGQLRATLLHNSSPDQLISQITALLTNHDKE